MNASDIVITTIAAFLSFGSLRSAILKIIIAIIVHTGMYIINIVLMSIFDE